MIDKSFNELSICVRADADFLKFIEIFHECDISTKIRGKFFLIKYTYSENLESEFCDFLLDSLVTYALTKSEVEEAFTTIPDGQKKIRATKFRKLYKQAISRYVRGSVKFKGGEIGELVLFHMLELVEHAVQITNKMSLKTSGKMPVHGADGVHFGINGNLKILYYGESKTGMTFSTVLYDAMESVNNFCKMKKSKREIELATGYPSDYLTKEIQAEIKDYLTTSKPDLSHFTQTYAVLLAYDTKELKEMERDFQGDELKVRVRNYYSSKIKDITSAILSKYSEYTDLQNKLFIFYIVPFKDLGSVRESVLNEVKNAE